MPIMPMNPFTPTESCVLFLSGCCLLVVLPSVFLPLFVFFPSLPEFLLLGAWPPLLFFVPVLHEYFRRVFVQSVISVTTTNPFSKPDLFVAVDVVEYNSSQIVRLPLLSRWVWRPTVLWLLASIPLILVPLAVMLPLGMQTTVDLSFTSDSKVAMWFFSIVFPMLYVAGLTWLLVSKHNMAVNKSSSNKTNSAAGESFSVKITADNEDLNPAQSNEIGLLQIQLGNLYPLWDLVHNHPRIIAHFLCAWAFVFIPIVCGLSKCIYNELHTKWPPSTTVPNESVQW